MILYVSIVFRQSAKWKKAIQWGMGSMALLGFSAEGHTQSGSNQHQAYKTLAADCANATAMVDLDVNNVQARLLNGGDWWWDTQQARYVVPKVDPSTGEPQVSSLFAGGLWIGGKDATGQLRLAAQRYRIGGREFWPGPLDAMGETDASRCALYDRFWSVNRDDIDAVIAAYESGTPLALPAIPAAVLSWPAKGNPYALGRADVPMLVDQNLAPFVDVDGNGLYDPSVGDHPDVFGDQAIFWVFNDAGNLHSATGGEAINLECRALAYAFATNDVLNDLTFYHLDMINGGSHNLQDAYAGLFTDVDLGWFLNDFIGCDTALDLAYAYNGTAIDGGGFPNYGDRPPLVGIKLLSTPWKAGASGDSVEAGMTGFVNLSGDFTVIGIPFTDQEHYYALSGRWRDGTPRTYGGNGFGGAIDFPFHFPDDPALPLPAWSECAIGNPPADRRFLQSTGPFALPPGARANLDWSVVWVRPEGPQDGCRADLPLLQQAAQEAQIYFDADFATLLNGPDAPDLEIEERDRQIWMRLSNGPGSNNAGEAYEETDPFLQGIADLSLTDSLEDATYRFQGYIIYQLRHASVSTAALNDPSQARVVAQVDIADSVGRLVNHSYDQVLHADVPVLMVDGFDLGVSREFHFTRDVFADIPDTLINHKTYYYAAVAYAYNGMAPYDPAFPEPGSRPFLAGRRNIKVYTAIPHPAVVDSLGTPVADACSRIRAVPNPYYAFSAYEASSLSRRIKFTNLPGRCTINIYTLDGQRIRQLERDVVDDQSAGGYLSEVSPNLDSSLDWDLENEAGLPVGSGAYLAHVMTPAGCERSLKLFVLQRALDLEGF